MNSTKNNKLKILGVYASDIYKLVGTIFISLNALSFLSLILSILLKDYRISFGISAVIYLIIQIIVGFFQHKTISCIKVQKNSNFLKLTAILFLFVSPFVLIGWFIKTKLNYSSSSELSSNGSISK